MGATWRVSPGGRQVFATGREFELRAELPYGIWICANGREVLFNRFYEPLRQRMPGGLSEEADPKEWVKNIVTQRWFYDDGVNEPAMRRRAKAALGDWLANRLVLPPKDED